MTEEPPKAPSQTNAEEILREAARKASDDQFWIARAKAIQAYARIEQELCRIFATVSGMRADVAAIVFFRIASASARNDILGKVIRLYFGRRYNLFWNSVLKDMRPIDIQRNEIVHWLVMSESQLTRNGLSEMSIVLRPPAYWSRLDKSSPQITNVDLLNFTRKCHFYIHVFENFSAITAHGAAAMISQEIIDSWLDIFHKPLVYPPPEGTPLSQILPKLGNPPQPSQG